MQRVIKFRGYSETVGHPAGMVYGSGCYIDQSSKHYIIDDSNGKPDFIRVRQVQEWTCLHDKNGKEIYEGDVVLHESWGPEPSDYKNRVTQKWPAEVFWDVNSWKIHWNGGTNTGLFATQDQKYGVEVIGNIYSTPDLLK